MAVAIAAAGCGAGTTGGLDRTSLAPAAASKHATLVSEGSTLWAKRGQGAATEDAIKKWEEALAIKADDWRTCEKLARAYHFAAGGWLSMSAPATRIKLHRLGFEVAERGLNALSPRFEKLRKQGSQIESAAEVIERDGIPLVYWYAANLGGYAYASGMGEGLKHKSRVENLIKHVYKIERPFFRYAADQFVAAFYAAAPAFIGGDMQKAAEHFAVLAKHAPNNLSALFLKARFFAVRKKDQALFDSLVKGILQAKPCAPANTASPCVEPGFEPEAELEKAKARRLQGRRAHYFSP